MLLIVKEFIMGMRGRKRKGWQLVILRRFNEMTSFRLSAHAYTLMLTACDYIVVDMIV